MHRWAHGHMECKPCFPSSSCESRAGTFSASVQGHVEAAVPNGGRKPGYVPWKQRVGGLCYHPPSLLYGREKLSLWLTESFLFQPFVWLGEVWTTLFGVMVQQQLETAIWEVGKQVWEGELPGKPAAPYLSGLSRHTGACTHTVEKRPQRKPFTESRP